jgi:hypothetical protein
MIKETGCGTEIDSWQGFYLQFQTAYKPKEKEIE